MPVEAAVLGVAAVAVTAAVGRSLVRRRRAVLVTARLSARASPHVAPVHHVVRGVLGGVAGWWLGGPAIAALGVAAALLVGPVRRGVARLGHDDRYDLAMIDLLAAFAGSLRSGAVVHVALAEAGAAVSGPVAADIDRLLARLEQGMALPDALRRWCDERPSPAVRAAAASLALGHETGGLRAEIVDGVAMAVRQRADARAEARGLATQARASAVVLALAPLVFVALGVVGGTDSSRFLLRTPVGLACLVSGLVLDAAAFTVMLRLVAGVAR